MMRTNIFRIIGAMAALWMFSTATVAASLTDGGFTASLSGEISLAAFNTTNTDVWAVESAVTVGAVGAVSPIDNPLNALDRMLQLNYTGGGASQVLQYVDVSLPGSGTTTATLSAWFNADVGGAALASMTVSAKTSAGLASGYIQFLTDTLVLDNDASTWEQIIVEMILPAGTNVIEAQLGFNNASIFVMGAGFADNASLQVATVPVPAAVWLFGSAIGLLGWMRRKAT
jgi:hypothetical protein